MSKSALRKDKTCLNCRHVVEMRFCPNCGQENTDSRKTFHHLFIHFFEDLTHYENAFWRTIRNLLFKPAALTKEYLSGKRLSYLAPVRLYIFISFLTFFLFTVIPDSEDHLIKSNQTTSVKTVDKNIAGRNAALCNRACFLHALDRGAQCLAKGFPAQFHFDEIAARRKPQRLPCVGKILIARQQDKGRGGGVV